MPDGQIEAGADKSCAELPQDQADEEWQRDIVAAKTAVAKDQALRKPTDEDR
jgi:hypothetical protein